jgi:hypothetical protein
MPYVSTTEQKAILAHDRHQHARVLAGPGTGKSATVVALVDLLRNTGTDHFPQPLRIADDWEDDEIVKPTLAQRINVRSKLEISP